MRALVAVGACWARFAHAYVHAPEMIAVLPRFTRDATRCIVGGRIATVLAGYAVLAEAYLCAVLAVSRAKLATRNRELTIFTIANEY